MDNVEILSWYKKMAFKLSDAFDFMEEQGSGQNHGSELGISWLLSYARIMSGWKEIEGLFSTETARSLFSFSVAENFTHLRSPEASSFGEHDGGPPSFMFKGEVLGQQYGATRRLPGG